MVKYVLLRSVFWGLSTFGGIKSAPVEKEKKHISIFFAFLLPRPPKGGGLVRGRIQSGLPLTSGANPSCLTDCQHQGTWAPGATLCDMVKYVVLRSVFKGFSIFGCIKSAPERKSKMEDSLFLTFLRPWRILDAKMSLNPPPKGVG